MDLTFDLSPYPKPFIFHFQHQFYSKDCMHNHLVFEVRNSILVPLWVWNGSHRKTRNYILTQCPITLDQHSVSHPMTPFFVLYIFLSPGCENCLTLTYIPWDANGPRPSHDQQIVRNCDKALTLKEPGFLDPSHSRGGGRIPPPRSRKPIDETSSMWY